MERNQNRKFNRNLRDRSEFCNNEDTHQRARRHQHNLQPAEDLIPVERLYQSRRRRFVESQGAVPQRGFRQRVGSAQYSQKPGQSEKTRYAHPDRVHLEPFRAPRDLMHEKWMLEMRIYRLNRKLKRLNWRLYERFI